jgi:hypothetical protein
METIRLHSIKLGALSESLDKWKTGPYKALDIGTAETLRQLHRYWLKCSQTPTRKVYEQTQTAMREVFSKLKAEDDELVIAPLIRSFGPDAGLWQCIASSHICEYWTFGVADTLDSPKQPICNPLFLYSSVAGDQFAIHKNTHPLSVFNLGMISVREPFDPSDRYNDAKRIKESMPKVLLNAKEQFRTWCEAFKTAEISLQFVIGDPMAFCYALLKQDAPQHVQFITNYSAPWSPNSTLDLKSVIPTSFNVIDTSNLMDNVGLVNVLVATVPLLEESPSSTIYTITATRPWPGDTEILEDYMGTPYVTCSVLGIAPVAYLTGVSNTGLSQDEALVIDMIEPEHPIPLQMVWKIPSGGDPNVKIQNKHCFDAVELSGFLFSIYTRMFVHEEAMHNILQDGFKRTVETKHISVRHTKAGFAAFVAFLKRRHSTNFDQAIEAFHELLKFTTESQDLRLQMVCMGVEMPKMELPSTEELKAMFPQLGDGEIRSPDEIKPVTFVVFTVPRARLRAVTQRYMERKVKYEFHVRLYSTPTSYQIFSSPSAAFGTLVTDSDGETRILFGDDGWHGISDLHITLPLLTSFFITETTWTISFHLTATPGTSKAFRKNYGKDLEIFRSSVLDTNHVRILNSLPNAPTTQPTLIPEAARTMAKSNFRITKSHPNLNFSKKSFATFTTRITFRGEFDRPFSRLQPKQTSPCVITVTYEGMEEACEFPFPVVGDTARLRVARKSGWIEVVVSLYHPPEDRIGGYSTRFMPLTRDNNGLLCSWSVPTLNFNRIEHLKEMPKGDSPGNNWSANVFETFTSDREKDEIRVLNIFNYILKAVKVSMFRIFSYIYAGPKHCIINLGTGGRTASILFITGVYFDFTLQTIVAKAYVFQFTADQVDEYPIIESVLSSMAVRNTAKTIQTTQLELDCWTRMFPALVGRCRDWKHLASCEYSGDLLTAPSVRSRTYCSCGRGKVGEDFLKVKEWKGMEKYVTLCALSAVFPAPFVEETRKKTVADFLKLANGVNNVSEKFTRLRLNPNMPAACQVCGSTKDPKKCSLCGKVFYCSRECQKKDWPTHKAVCPVLSKTPA